jgi:hypothetical protein
MKDLNGESPLAPLICVSFGDSVSFGDDGDIRGIPLQFH